MADHKIIEIDNKEYRFEIRHSHKEEAGIYLVYGFDEYNNADRIRYVGESDNIKNRMSGHEKEECWKKYHNEIEIYVHLESNEEKRLKIEEKIIDELKPPCNKEK